MSTLFITHPACLEHITPAGHPERPDRLRAIERIFESEAFQGLALPLTAKSEGSARNRAAVVVPYEICYSPLVRKQVPRARSRTASYLARGSCTYTNGQDWSRIDSFTAQMLSNLRSLSH